MSYQFLICKQPAGPVHDDWAVAVQDAVAAGYAVWIDERAAQFDSDGSVERLGDASI